MVELDWNLCAIFIRLHVPIYHEEILNDELLPELDVSILIEAEEVESRSIHKAWDGDQVPLRINSLFLEALLVLDQSEP